MPSYVLDLIKLGVAVLAGYLGVASFLPSVLERLQKFAANASETILERREFDEVFNRSLNASTATLGFFAGGYLITGLGTIVLLGYVALSTLPCRGITCFTDWVPVAGGIAIAYGLLVLLVATASVLTVYMKAARQALMEVSSNDN